LGWSFSTISFREVAGTAILSLDGSDIDTIIRGCGGGNGLNVGAAGA